MLFSKHVGKRVVSLFCPSYLSKPVLFRVSSSLQRPSLCLSVYLCVCVSGCLSTSPGPVLFVPGGGPGAALTSIVAQVARLT